MKHLSEIEIKMVVGGINKDKKQGKVVKLQTQLTPEEGIPRPVFKEVKTQFTPEEQIPRPAFTEVKMQFRPEQPLPKSGD